MREAKKRVDVDNHDRTLRGVQAHIPRVTSVTDAKSDALVHVTKRDVDWASKKNHSHCALARACEAMVGVDAAIISRATAYLVYGKVAIRYRLPTATINEVVAFDRGGDFMPGEYLLKAPGKSAKLGAGRNRPSGRHSKNPTKRRRYAFTQGIRSRLVKGSK